MISLNINIDGAAELAHLTLQLLCAFLSLSVNDFCAISDSSS